MDATSGMRLSPDDARILALESPSVAGHTLKLNVLAPGPEVDLAGLRTRVIERLPLLPRSLQRVDLSGDGPHWVAATRFDVRDHVRAHPGRVRSTTDLWRAIGLLMAEHLPRDRPLWTIDLLGPLDDGSQAVAVRLHHAMADGVAGIRFLREVLWDAYPSPRPRPAAPSPAAPNAGRVRKVRRMTGAVVRELGHPGTRSPFDLTISGARELTCFPLSVTEMKAIGASRPRRATVNDVLLAVVTGGLREWLDIRPGHLEHLNAQIPVSLHRAGDEAGLGNRDSFLNVGLPLGEPDPLARLDRLSARTSVRKQHRDAQELDEAVRLAHRFPRVSGVVQHLAASGREFSLAVSNLPGPRGPVSVGGREVRHLYTSSEPGEHHALRISAISCGDELTVALCTDPDALPGVAALADAMERSYVELRDAAGRL